MYERIGTVPPCQAEHSWPRFSLRRLLLSISLFGLTFACLAQLPRRELDFLWLLGGCWAFGAAIGALRGSTLRGGAFGLLGYVIGLTLGMLSPPFFW